MTHPDPPPWEQQLADGPPSEEDAPSRRRIWVAIGVVLLGVVVLGVAAALQSVWVAAPGAVLVALGGGLAYVWGIMTDVED